MRRTLVGASALLLLGAAVYGGAASATPSHGVTNPSWSPVVGRFQSGIEARAKTDIDPGDATDYWKVDISAKGATDVQVIENIVAPGASFGWHSHPGPSLVIVRTGTLSVYHGTNCTTPEEYGPGSPLGSTFVDQGHDLHLVRNNTSATDDVYVVSFLPAGAARRIDEPNPAPGVCPN
jgi:quercetin dioxygenase-like cupin family protein